MLVPYLFSRRRDFSRDHGRRESLTAQSFAAARKRRQSAFQSAAGFSLVELIAVMAIVSTLAFLVIPATSSLQTRGGLDRATADITSALESARTYAMSNRTYVYFGMQEVDGVSPTAANGVGRIVVAAIASVNGIRPPISDWSSGLSNDVVLIEKPAIFDYVHLATVPVLNSVPGASTSPTMKYRPTASVDLGSTGASLTFPWPLSGQPQNTFGKVIEFDPLGVARVQTDATSYDTSILSYIEIPLLTAHGDVAANNSIQMANQAAVQVDGVTGAVRIYRP